MAVMKKSIAFAWLLTAGVHLFAQTEGNTSPTGASADSVKELEEVSIESYGMRRILDVPGSVSVISGNPELMNTADRFTDLINTLPGIEMQSGTYATNRLVIRGMGSRTPYNTNRIRVYLDEIPLTSSDGVSAPEEMDPGTFGRIEVVKGPSSAMFGSGLGGSLNLYTPGYKDSTARIGLRYGSFNTLKVNASGSGRRENSVAWGNIAYLQSDGYRENSKYQRLNLIGTSEYKTGNWNVSALVLMNRVYGQIPSSIGKTLFNVSPASAAANWKSIGGFKEGNRVVGGLRFGRSFGSKFSNRLLIFGRLNDTFERRPFNNLDDGSIGAGFRNRLNFHYGNIDLSLGTEWITEQYRWTLEKNDTLLNRNRENRSQWGLFSVLYWKPSNRLSFTSAIALNHVSYRLNDLFHADGDLSGVRSFPVMFSPRTGINFKLSESVSLYSSAGHGFSLPSPEETLLPQGEVNRGIRPEQGWQLEAGIRASILNNRLKLDAGWYYIALRDLLVTKRISEDIFTGINAGKTRHTGMEILLIGVISQLDHFPGRTEIRISYSGSTDLFKEFTDDGLVYDGNRLPGIPVSLLRVNMNWIPNKKLEINGSWYHTGKQYLNDLNSLSYPGHRLSDARISYKASRFIDIYLGADNIGNSRYASMLVVNALAAGMNEPRYYYPGLPRRFYAGVTVLF